MKVLHCLAILTVFLNCPGALADDDWRDDNPNKPNGYEASMLRYHYGTPGGDEPANGYAATSIRSNRGLDGYLPPDKDDGWGGGDSDSGGGGGRWGGGGGGFGSGSGLGRHFRQGVNESQSYWTQRMQNHLGASQMRPQSMGTGNQFHGNNFNDSGGVFNGAQRSAYNLKVASNSGQMQNSGYGNPNYSDATAYGGRQFAGNQFGNNQYAGNQFGGSQNGSNGGNQYGGNQYGANRFGGSQNFNMNQPSPGAYSTGNYQYAPSNGSYSNHYGNSTALQAAVGQKPLATLLRNSRGGFHQIYAQ